MKKLLVPLFCVVAFALPANVFAWGDHTLITDRIFTGETAETVKAETLDQFLEAEKTNIASMLKEDEIWLRTNITAYKPLPDALIFTGSSSGPALRKDFLHALRINADLPCSLFLQLPIGVAHTRPPLTALDVSTYEITIPNGPFEKVSEGEELSSLNVLSTASDEPDYGMDIGLYENNNTELGKTYGLGMQPFGNPVYIYGSQAPFHMGFFHENSIIQLAAPFIKETNVEYRFHQFSALSALAFKNGHTYWGYRFAGWALHYLQDESVLYHAVMVPGVSTFALLKASLLKNEVEKNRLLSEVSNKHVVFEDYQFDALVHLLSKGDVAHPIIAALSDKNHDADVPVFGEKYIREVVSKNVADRTTITDAVLVRSFPERYISDITYVYGTTEPEMDLYALLQSSPDTQKEMDAELSRVFRDLGSYSRQYVAWLHEGRPDSNTKKTPPTNLILAALVLVALSFVVFRKKKK